MFILPAVASVGVAGALILHRVLNSDSDSDSDNGDEQPDSRGKTAAKVILLFGVTIIVILLLVDLQEPYTAAPFANDFNTTFHGPMSPSQIPQQPYYQAGMTSDGHALYYTDATKTGTVVYR